jgi:hypothetical protein
MLNNTWQFFMGYRYAMFNYATPALRGAVTLRSFKKPPSGSWFSVTTGDRRDQHDSTHGSNPKDGPAAGLTPSAYA